jgi:hypothetical protein
MPFLPLGQTAAAQASAAGHTVLHGDGFLTGSGFDGSVRGDNPQMGGDDEMGDMGRPRDDGPRTRPVVRFTDRREQH